LSVINQEKGTVIRYGFQASPFGEVTLALAGKAICGLSLCGRGQRRRALTALQRLWPEAELIHDQKSTRAMARRIFSRPGKRTFSVHLIARGTAFQIKVWKALLTIPGGRLASYQDIARKAGHPAAVRATGTAIGQNPIGYLIPCHRVIRKNGSLGQYAWGTKVKKKIIDWEKVRA